MNFDPSDLSAMGILGGAFLMMLRWMSGNLQEQIRSEGRANRLALRQTSQAVLVVASGVNALSKQLLHHDAQVRGLNLSVGEDNRERLERAREAYNALVSTLEDQGRKISDAIDELKSINSNVTQAEAASA